VYMSMLLCVSLLALALALLESPSSVAGEPWPGSAAQVRPAISG